MWNCVRICYAREGTNTGRPKEITSGINQNSGFVLPNVGTDVKHIAVITSNSAGQSCP